MGDVGGYAAAPNLISQTVATMPDQTPVNTATPPAYGNAPGQLQALNYNAALQNAVQQGFGGTTNAQAQQNALMASLAQQMQGKGPNLAQQQLAMARQQNAAAAASQIASQRGVNPGLATRMISQQESTANQQAAGQAAEARLQQQMAAQQQLAQLSLGQQQQNLQQQQIAGSLWSNQNEQAIQNAALNAQIQGQNAGLNLSEQGLKAGVNMGQSQQDIQMAGATMSAIGTALPYLAAAAAHGGMIPAKPHLGQLKAKGGKVPGKPKVSYDSALNDTVHTLLSPGEVVIPLSIMRRPDAPQAAAKFVADTIRKHGGPPAPTQHFDVGGMTLPMTSSTYGLGDTASDQYMNPADMPPTVGALRPPITTPTTGGGRGDAYGLVLKSPVTGQSGAPLPNQETGLGVGGGPNDALGLTLKPGSVKGSNKALQGMGNGLQSAGKQLGQPIDDSMLQGAIGRALRQTGFAGGEPGDGIVPRPYAQGGTVAPPKLRFPRDGAKQAKKLVQQEQARKALEMIAQKERLRRLGVSPEMALARGLARTGARR